MSIYKKLLAIQSENIAVAKDATNPHFKSKYMDLETIIETYTPILSKNKVVVVHSTKDSVLTTSLIDTEGDTMVSSEFAILNTDPQKRWGEITYGRRYNLQQLLNILAEDDDGNKASENFTSVEDDKPWFNQPNLDALAKVVANYSSLEALMKEARGKYKISKKAEAGIAELYNNWTITKI